MVYAVGGMGDHVHLLFDLPSVLPLSKAMLLLKANSSKWMNEHGSPFAWQEGYGAFAVSASNTATVQRYIENQFKHHRKISFDTEFIALLKKHGIAFDPKHALG
jgi:putative transposase